MSYQPGYPDPAGWQPPTAQIPASPPGATAPIESPTQTQPRGRKGLLLAGVGLMALGFIGAVISSIMVGSANSKSVTGLGRVVPNFETTVNFESPGEYTMYYESQGTFTSDLDGDERETTLNGPDEPVRFDVAIIDRNGAEIRVRRAEGTSYAEGGFVGTAVRRVNITDPGAYRVTVTPRTGEEDGFAVAIGKGVLSKRSMVPAILVLASGLVIGGALIALSRRPRAIAPLVPGAPTTVWQPGSPWPAQAPHAALTPTGPPLPGATPPPLPPVWSAPPVSSVPMGPPSSVPVLPPPPPPSAIVSSGDGMPSWTPVTVASEPPVAPTAVLPVVVPPLPPIEESRSAGVDPAPPNPWAPPSA